MGFAGVSGPDEGAAGPARRCRTCEALPGLRGAAGRRGRCQACGALPGGVGAAGRRGRCRTAWALPGLRGAAGRRGRCQACGALPDGVGVARPAGRCRTSGLRTRGRALPQRRRLRRFELIVQKKAQYMKEAAVHLVQRLLSLRKTRNPGRRKHRVEDFRRRVSVVRRSASSDLVQGLPQTLVPPFPLHQVFGPFRSSSPSDLVQRLPQNLVLSFPLHQVFGLFRSFNPSDLVQRLPQNLIPPFPLHQVFGPFRSTNPLGLVQRLPQNLVLSFPLHQVFGPFRSFNPLDLVQRFLQNLVLSFLLHHVPSPRWPAAFTDVVLHSPQSLIPSSRGTTSSPPDGIGKGSADEFAIRLHFLPLLFCIDRKSSGAIAPLLFLHNPIKFYYFTFPLLFGVV